ncbi:hypothetical protein B0I35DRAFT_127631 [Stachybotrys elegans]|uniref:PLL-like beta propeller domain-containing protein n=1 Tax=Stachybotrys elegans TaxID=80388 RepID=A0A8K0T461_9HYPO|nr:hypothetical protein B0I35DRAFT_127631 [Stachybotrys elegans]
MLYRHSNITSRSLTRANRSGGDDNNTDDSGAGRTDGSDTGRTDGAGSGHTDTPTHSTGTVDAVFGTPTAFAESIDASESACHGQICPPLLTAVRPDSVSGRFWLFGRGSDSAYWFRESDGQRWTSEWTSLNGSFISQPAVVSVNSERVDVFGLWEDNLTMRTKMYRRGEWDSD